MKTDADPKAGSDGLRRRAEERLKLRQPPVDVQRTALELDRVVHELQVHQIELELQNEELVASKANLALYEDLYDWAPVGYLSFDKAGKILRANLTAARLLGVERANLANNFFGGFVVQSDRGAFDGFLNRVFSTRDKQTCELELTLKAASRLFVRVEAVLSEEALDCRAALLSIGERKQSDSARDAIYENISERKRAELALRESEQRFSQLADNIDEVFWIIDVDQDKTVYVSPAYETIWGRTRESLYSAPHSWMESIHPDDQEQVQHAVSNKQKLGGYDEIFRVRRPDGSVRWVRDRAFPVRNAEGNVFRVVGIATDVTKTKDLEEQVRQSQKMEAFGLLAGGVAHDFNNLLNVVIGYSDMWLMKLPPDAPTRRPFTAIKKAGERAGDLTKQLLAFSRKTILEPKVLDLNVVIRDTEKMLARMIGEDIQLSTLLDPAIPKIKVDPGQIGQVLINLAVNARDAMTRGGDLTIQTGTAEFNEAYVASHPGTQPGRHVSLAISDTGSGIPAEILPRIFEPFFTTKVVGKGTGLGLAVVHGIVSQSGGSIEVESKIGVGTTFKMYFPITTEVPETPQERGPILAHAGIETVLVVEDETHLREMTEETLRSFGYQVLSARSGQDALKLLETTDRTVDLMLTDVVMPGMSGRLLAETVLKKSPELRVLFMSGYTDDSVVRHGVNHEKVAFLQKPFAPFDLLKKVREVLDKR